jgi:antirestriction protein ArdC
MTKDIQSEVTDRIIEALETSTAPWHKPWKSGATGYPLRSTGQAYRGINVLLLWLASDKAGYSSDYWFTYKQAQEFGGQVRKGEKSTGIVYYNTLEKENEETEEIERIPFLKQYRVFNADQIADLPEKFYARPIDQGARPIADFERFFNSTGCKRQTGLAAFYTPATDVITMPAIETFACPQAYYGTLAHELTHWTGATHRLDRFGKVFKGTKDYAFEELIAEIGSCFVSAEIGALPDFDQSAAYLKHWIKHLKDDKKFIFKAAAAAQRAADYIMECSAVKDEKLVA